MDLGNPATSGNGWGNLITELSTWSGSFASLNLTNCTVTTNAINPVAGQTAGMAKISTLILPPGITSIQNGTSSAFPTFRLFTNLRSITGSGITNIGNYAFGTSGNLNLQTANFVNAITVGNGAFSGCTGLTSVDIRSVTTIGDAVFDHAGQTNGNRAMFIYMGQNAPTLGTQTFGSSSGMLPASGNKTVTIRVPGGNTGYTSVAAGANVTVNWGNGLRGAGWTGTAFRDPDFASLNINQRIAVTVAPGTWALP
jgi:hypothetical protein